MKVSVYWHNRLGHRRRTKLDRVWNQINDTNEDPGVFLLAELASLVCVSSPSFLYVLHSTNP